MISPQNVLFNGTMLQQHAAAAAAAAAAGLQPLTQHPGQQSVPGVQPCPVPGAKDSRWLTLEVCREHQRGKCSRVDLECKFAHPPGHVEVQNGRVTCCFDSIKGKCQRKDPPCKYLHPPVHLREQLLQNGRTNLLMRNLAQYPPPIPAFGQPMPCSAPAVAITSTPMANGVASNSVASYPGSSSSMPSSIAPQQSSSTSNQAVDKLYANAAAAAAAAANNPMMSQYNPMMANQMFMQIPYLNPMSTMFDANGMPMQNPLGTMMMPQKLDLRSGQIPTEAQWITEQPFYPAMNLMEANGPPGSNQLPTATQVPHPQVSSPHSAAAVAMQVAQMSQFLSMNKKRSADMINDPLGLNAAAAASGNNAALLGQPGLLKRTAVDKNGLPTPAMAYPSQYQQMALQIQAQHQALTGQALQSASGQTGQTPPSTTPNSTQFNNITQIVSSQCCSVGDQLSLKSSSSLSNVAMETTGKSSASSIVAREKRQPASNSSCREPFKQQICRDYKMNRCKRTPCKYAHVDNKY